MAKKDYSQPIRVSKELAALISSLQLELSWRFNKPVSKAEASRYLLASFLGVSPKQLEKYSIEDITHMLVNRRRRPKTFI